jgi:hypothetical protein
VLLAIRRDGEKKPPAVTTFFGYDKLEDIWTFEDLYQGHKNDGAFLYNIQFGVICRIGELLVRLQKHKMVLLHASF